MTYWAKYFTDGTRVIGSDDDSAASWSKSRLSDMVAAELVHDGFKLRIFGPGVYWQSETAEALFPQPHCTIVARRIEKQMAPTDKWFCICETEHGLCISFNQEVSNASQYVAVTSEHHGKWLILEYDIRTKKARFYFKDAKL